MSERKYPVKRGGEYELVIDRLAFGGAGVGRIENYVIFVKDTLPGEKVLARIRKRKSSYAEARLLEIIESSPLRQEAPCPYFQWCGGCTWQNLSYPDQLEHKRNIVQESLKHISGLDNLQVAEVIESDEQLGYRNKMEFSFSDRRWLLPHELNNEGISKDFALGLHVPGTFDKIIDIDNCLLQSQTANHILKYISSYCREFSLAPYGIRSHQGFLRFLVLRQSKYNGTIMVNFVNAYEDLTILQPLAEKLSKEFPEISSIVNNINSRPAQIAFGEKEILLYGKAYIQDRLGPFIFNISANSFFQTNTLQAEKLYAAVIKFAELQVTDTVWDLYSGTGTISLFLALKAKKVTGFEMIESAVEDAVINAKKNNVKNTHYIAGDLLHTIQSHDEKPDIIVTDPPRAGMHEKVVRAIEQIKARTIVYVSCNPTSLARDLQILTDSYSVEAVQPVDMFAQTYHIETVVKLVKKDS